MFDSYNLIQGEGGEEGDRVTQSFTPSSFCIDSSRVARQGVERGTK